MDCEKQPTGAEIFYRVLFVGIETKKPPGKTEWFFPTSYDAGKLVKTLVSSTTGVKNEFFYPVDLQLCNGMRPARKDVHFDPGTHFF